MAARKKAQSSQSDIPTKTATLPRVRIGISGWRYAGWRGVFYPEGLAQRRELEFASRQFETIEINGTFYSLQHLKSFQQWARETPDDFVFSLKGSRYITHMLKLRGIEAALANYFGSGMLTLGPKCGPILWQFAPQMRFDRGRFETFFRLLPRTVKQAASFARRHATRLADPSAIKVPSGSDAPIRHCVEIRHESFVTPEFIDLLREHNIGLVPADTVEWPLLLDVTSDFVYCRLHGSEQLYFSGYDPPALDLWASRIQTWANGGTPNPDPTTKPEARLASPILASSQPRDVFVYFDNDAKVRAPFDAQDLRSRVQKRLL
ncbi:DUF72 domain-containing protein [Granulicella sp. dw_53]|uniref:DUF72 domain-containing protein n=1 Tax=Granulicella sp. dw_53 TaxID=2719792 RepID=UPI001BD55948|nr:DUF72 domain-containing protein [Granulicella sp. dw_53]